MVIICIWLSLQPQLKKKGNKFLIMKRIDQKIFKIIAENFVWKLSHHIFALRFKKTGNAVLKKVVLKQRIRVENRRKSLL